jgi:hypothetical protein
MEDADIEVVEHNQSLGRKSRERSNGHPNAVYRTMLNVQSDVTRLQVFQTPRAWLVLTPPV